MPPVEQFRGVALGGWLVFESFISPYMFTLTDCDINGEFYDIRIGDRNGVTEGGNRNTVTLPGNSTKNCTPLEKYPVDMWTLASAFPNKDMARSYFERHWDTWVVESDIARIASAGLTHVKIPIGHWILGDIKEDEPWIDGDWPYFVRAAKWCRQYGLKIVADIHTAPGSQNGFDNSGHLFPEATAVYWSSNHENVARSLKVVKDLAKAVRDEGLEDVVTGIEILNEIFSDANATVVRQFYEDSLEAIRSNLGESTVVIVSDVFDGGLFNEFWADEEKHKNTLLDSHLYSIFSEKLRSMSPKQHVAFVCGNYGIELLKCCWADNRRSPGMGRIIGEWTAAYDSLVAAQIVDIKKAVAKTGVAPRFDRELSSSEKAFLKDFVEAQMVVYEGNPTDEGASNGWFYWNFKMEGGAFAEWDYTRGVEEGWIPIAETDVPSFKRFGDCDSIILRTKDDYSAIHEFPDPSDLPSDQVEDKYFDDDVVMTHGASLERGDRVHEFVGAFILIGIAVLFVLFKMRKQKKGYDPLPNADKLPAPLYKSVLSSRTVSSDSFRSSSEGVWS